MSLYNKFINMSSITIILVEPQMGENIGAAARVMGNFGFSDLRIVNPRDGWPNKKAIAMAAASADILRNATIYPSLAEALYDVKLAVAVTARKRDMEKKYLPPKEFGNHFDTIANRSQIAIVFGSERTGLSNEQVALCDYITTIPTEEKHRSLNLAQAVAIICYELSSCKIADHKIAIKEKASKKDIVILTDRIMEKLEEKHFFKDKGRKKPFYVNLLSLFTKQDLTIYDINNLHGIIKALSGGEFIIIYSTTSSQEEAEKIATAIIAKKKAACVNIIPGMNSIYQWEGKVEKGEEYSLLIKTDKRAEKEVYQIIKSLHSYQTPCLATINLENIEENFAKWLANSLKHDI